MSGVRHSIPVAVIIGMMGAGKTRVGKEAMSECSIQEKLHQLRMT